MRVAADEAAALASLARAAYLAHYARLWADGGHAYASRSFAEQVLARELEDRDVVYWRIETGARVAGFAKVVLPAASLNREAPRLHYLARLYLLADAVGAGVGGEALLAIEAEASAAGAEGLWLRVMRDWPRVRAFYVRRGYRECGGARLDEAGVVPELAEMVYLSRRF